MTEELTPLNIITAGGLGPAIEKMKNDAFNHGRNITGKMLLPRGSLGMPKSTAWNKAGLLSTTSI